MAPRSQGVPCEKERQSLHGRDGHAPFFRAAILKALGGTPERPCTLSWFASKRDSRDLQTRPSLIADHSKEKTPSGEPEGVLLSF
jgi:hypothetical protein